MDPARLVLTFLVTFVASLGLTWLVRGAMRRARIYDVPTEARKATGRLVPYEGGVAMYFGFLVGLVCAFWFFPVFFFDRFQIYGLVVGATCAVAVGVFDDLLNLRPTVKLLAQLGIGALMYAFDFRIERLSNPFGGDISVWQYGSLAVTVLWYALLMNGINMIDGLDGLAAGITGITGITLFAIALDLDQSFSAVLALLLIGICSGFLPFNFSPASIFMGDAGSLLLGFLLASITLLSSTKAPALLALLIPMLAVGLPLFEILFAFLRRTLHGQHPFRGDRRHLHHRFLALGLTEKRTVLTFYYITAYLGVTAYVLQRLEARATMALVVIIALGMLLLVENMRYLEHKHPKP